MLDIAQSGNTVTWTQDVTKPMQLSLKFEVTIDGDQMIGTAKAGFLPAAKIAGARAS
jgi:hypothetical protein